jgi:N-acetylglucosaminyldiphosphoundecaprenol N-acetyl-beta-D-mannosaminyltransferase
MTGRIRIGSLPIDRVTLPEALRRIEELVAAGSGGTVYTPNVDHIMVAESQPEFRAAYERVSLSLVDGTPVVWASHLLGTPLPERVSGSDLFDPLLALAAERGWRVYLMGGGPGVAEIACRKLVERLPGLNFVGTDAPRVSADGECSERELVIERIRKARPDLVLVAFGAPKSELFCYKNFAALAPGVMVCVGAAIDFAAGTARRAPRWMARLGVEWLFRFAQEPRRLAYRYLVRDPQFVLLAARQFSRRRERPAHGNGAPD